MPVAWAMLRGGIRGRLLVAVAVVGLVVSAGCNGSGTGEAFDDDVAAELDAVVERGLAQTAAGGLVVRVDAPAGQRTMAAGPADVNGEEELTGDEAFRIASITKLFTATVALQLAEEGVVDLDAPVADVIPDRAGGFEHGEQMTLRQLLGHTAGLPRGLPRGGLEPGFFAEARELNSMEDGEVAASCAAVADLDPLDYLEEDALFAPGTDWAYSNIGYRLAGAVMEAVTDEPLEDAYRSRILEPLGMDETWLDCPEEPRGELAAGIHPPDIPAPIDVLPAEIDEPLDVTYQATSRAAGAAGGVVSTADDLTVFARALFGGELFDDPATLDAMLNPGPSGQYGLGVILDGDVVGHNGGLIGYNTRLGYHRQRDIVVVVFNNGTPPPGPHLAGRVATEVLNVVTPAEQDG